MGVSLSSAWEDKIPQFSDWWVSFYLSSYSFALPSNLLLGWVSVIGWQASSATGTYLGGTIIQAIVALNYPDYVPERWQATLMLYAVLLLTLLVNTFLVKWLPSLEGLILMLHIVGFFATLIPIVHLAPISSVDFVFKTFSNTSGYKSSGLSWLIGQASSAVLFIGYDGACHMGKWKLP